MSAMSFQYALTGAESYQLIKTQEDDAHTGLILGPATSLLMQHPDLPDTENYACLEFGVYVKRLREFFVWGSSCFYGTYLIESLVYDDFQLGVGPVQNIRRARPR